MKKILLFIVFTLFIFNVHSQVKTIIYVNEHNEEIDFSSFNKKLESGLFTRSFTINDATVFKQLILKEFFDELDSKKKSQLNKLSLNSYKTDIANIWYIHYRTDELNRSSSPNMIYVFTNSLTKESKQKKVSYFTRRASSRYIETNDPDTINFFLTY